MLHLCLCQRRPNNHNWAPTRQKQQRHSSASLLDPPTITTPTPTPTATQVAEGRHVQSWATAFLLAWTGDTSRLSLLLIWLIKANQAAKMEWNACHSSLQMWAFLWLHTWVYEPEPEPEPEHDMVTWALTSAGAIDPNTCGSDAYLPLQRIWRKMD